jgi:hypothetical protein
MAGSTSGPPSWCSWPSSTSVPGILLLGGWGWPSPSRTARLQHAATISSRGLILFGLGIVRTSCAPAEPTGSGDRGNPGTAPAVYLLIGTAACLALQTSPGSPSCHHPGRLRGHGRRRRAGGHLRQSFRLEPFKPLLRLPLQGAAQAPGHGPGAFQRGGALHLPAPVFPGALPGPAAASDPGPVDLSGSAHTHHGHQHRLRHPDGHPSGSWQHAYDAC